jgi:hypothetical protein
MARGYTSTSGKTSLAASTTVVAVQLATGTTVTNNLQGFDVTFDSTATGAGAVPVLVELTHNTGASSGGSTYTPTKHYIADAAAVTTSRINDTSNGASPTIIMQFLVSPTGGFSYQFPLGREIEMSVSDFLEVVLISQSGMTTCNYVVNVHFEE